MSSSTDTCGCLLNTFKNLGLQECINPYPANVEYMVRS